MVVLAKPIILQNHQLVGMNLVMSSCCRKNFLEAKSNFHSHRTNTCCVVCYWCKRTFFLETEDVNYIQSQYPISETFAIYAQNWNFDKM